MAQALLDNGAREQPMSGLAEIMQGGIESIELDPKLASLPRLLLMGPRRGGKTSIQVSYAFNALCST
jgi:hypothetical protein